MALEITIEGLKTILNSVRTVVAFSPTLADDTVMQLVNPIAERILANKDLPDLLSFVNMVLKGRFGAAPAGYDQEAYAKLAELCAEVAKANAQTDGS